MTVKSLVGVVVGLLCCSGVARSEDTSLVEKTYPVGEIVAYFQLLTKEHGGDLLVATVMGATEPASWDAEGTIAYLPASASLVVHARPAIHEQVEQGLNEIRQLLVPISVEVLIVRVPRYLGEWLEDLEINCRPIGNGKPHITYLIERERHSLLEQLQGNRGTQAIQAPKITVFNGVAGTFEVNRQHGYMTGVQIAQENGKLLLMPRHDPVTLGVRLGLLPLVCTEHRRIRIGFQARVTSLISDQAPFMAAGDEVPATSGEPMPADEINTLQLDETLSCRFGETAVLSGWLFKREQPGHCFLNWARRLPVVKEVTQTPTDEEVVLILVTPRILERETLATDIDTVVHTLAPTEPASPKMLHAEPDTQDDVNKLLARYRDACQAGRHAEARKLARKALRLDPACFDKR